MCNIKFYDETSVRPGMGKLKNVFIAGHGRICRQRQKVKLIEESKQ